MSDDTFQRLAEALADRYALEEEIGRGGMAVVYRAEDLRHGRKVAVKVLRPTLASTIGTERFLREIQVVARLEHPHVLTLIDSGEAGGLPWYVMPYVEGHSLRELLEREGALPVQRAVEIARGIADALQAAHEKGVVHRDIKPGNVLLSGGHPVVSDFGIAGALDEAARGDLTETGVSLGSPVYMSPEQAAGDTEIDARTDVYALGCVLWEMLAGRPPFDGPVKSLLTRKIMGEVTPLRDVRPDVPGSVARAVERAMEVEPEDRFETASRLREALQSAGPVRAPAEERSSHRLVLAGVGVALVVVAALVAVRHVHAEAERERWARERIEEAETLADRGRYPEALGLVEEVGEILPGDSTVANLLPRISFTVPVETDPPGARVLLQDMGAAEGAWDTLGTTPIEGVRFAGTTFEFEGGATHFGYRPSRLRFELEGYRPRELLLTAILGARWRGIQPLDPVVLTPENPELEGMVRIPGFTRDSLEHEPFFMARHEVTNTEFADFVKAGGYRDPTYWEPPFVREDGEELTFEEAMALFEDQTGRPGPATWRLGVPPEGREDHPVRGVSWHEAAAYARWAGKELPVRAQWMQGRRFYTEASHVVVPRSNLGGDGPRPVGRNRALTPLGVYDMVGNVQEWISNPAGEGRRATIGGAWGDPPFAAFWAVGRPAFERNPRTGFRLVHTSEDEATLAALRTPIQPAVFRDYRSEEPASDAEYAVFERLYAYDPVPPDPVVERVDTAEHWVREIVSYERPYGERGLVALYLPRNASVPYQAVLYWGGSGVKTLTSVDQEFVGAFDFIVRSGRAVVVPLLAGTYGRPADGRGEGRGVPSRGTVAHRDLFVEWVKDYRTTLDYLETREDVDPGGVGYFGLSWGGATAPVLLAVEPRIDAAVLNVGGLTGDPYQPEVDPFHFAPRVETPFLMISGEHDTVFPYETSQRPLFELVGTGPDDKRHHLSQASHLVSEDEVIRETLDWYDHYLGRPGG